MEPKKWIFTLSREVDGKLKESFLKAIKEKLSQWHAHGEPVQHEAYLIDNKFLEIKAYSYTSGCSIDWLIRTVKEVCGMFQLGPLENDVLTFVSSKGKLMDVPFRELESYIQQGEVGMDTEFYDKHSALQGGSFRVKVRDSWLSRYFSKEASV